MLDDRNTKPGPLPADLLTWSYDSNYTGWVTLLGDALGADDVPPAAAPARLASFDGLPPAYIEVGDLDIFRDESITYALGLARAGVPIELHVHPGAPHGFERFVPGCRRGPASHGRPGPRHRHHLRRPQGGGAPGQVGALRAASTAMIQPRAQHAALQ